MGQSSSGHVIFQAQKPSKAHSSDKTSSFAPNLGYSHIQSPSEATGKESLAAPFDPKPPDPNTLRSDTSSMPDSTRPLHQPGRKKVGISGEHTVDAMDYGDDMLSPIENVDPNQQPPARGEAGMGKEI